MESSEIWILFTSSGVDHKNKSQACLFSGWEFCGLTNLALWRGLFWQKQCLISRFLTHRGHVSFYSFKNISYLISCLVQLPWVLVRSGPLYFPGPILSHIINFTAPIPIFTKWTDWRNRSQDLVCSFPKMSDSICTMTAFCCYIPKGRWLSLTKLQ